MVYKLTVNKVVISLILFFVMYPFAACKSPSSSSANTTGSGNTSLNAQGRQFLRRINEIINLKERANVLKQCNTTKDKVLAEIMKRYKKILKNMSNKGVKKFRIKDFVREQKITGSFAITSTNRRTRQISFKNGQFLHMDNAGVVKGSPVTAGNKNNTIFYVKPTGPQVVMLQSSHTKKYVAMDKHGHIHAKTNPDHDALFYSRSEENLFLTLASYKYYLLCPYDMFLAVRNTGAIKSPHQSVPGQISTQIIFVPVP
ncbi:uncharacterized protein LOC114534410 isoform X2 [Dendronephthya gigantea]|uniref:uncharacterized protein LOC114534410 isoform X2 n=1 Tax=Dendronephthya gigantea TaxID=151771 RepID=UPI00106D0030|nr:uncharacterized protein LOC114534410 isoform X2 [Dendronephthya gigantea]